MNVKKDLLEIYTTAIHEVEGGNAVKKYVPKLFSEKTIKPHETVSVIAIGKAADAMLKGLLSATDLHVKEALLISKHGHISEESYQHSRIQCVEADHPVPAEASLSAGKTLLNYVQQLSGVQPCIVLMSGGASSLVEVLNEGWELAELQELTQWMLANSYSIDEMNAVRSRVSRIKGGGLWHYFLNHQRLMRVVCLLISDVPSDDERIIGSGLLFPAAPFVSAPESLPSQWKKKLADTQKITVPDSFSSHIVATNKQAQQAAATKARELGYRVITEGSLYEGYIHEGRAVDLAKQCVQTLRNHTETLFIWGAETTVSLPDSPGKGGRNQHLALAAAIEMDKKNDKGVDIVLLAAGTDGTDGVTDDAGGIVDNETVTRGEREGLNAINCFKEANSGCFLEASGDLIITGVTGTNVMDLIIAYAKPA